MARLANNHRALNQTRISGTNSFLTHTLKTCLTVSRSPDHSHMHVYDSASHHQSSLYYAHKQDTGID